MTGVGIEVRRLRESKGWGQTKLAAEAGMAVSGVSQIENGHRNPNSATLIKLARALEVEVSELFPKAHGPSLPEPSLFNGLSGAGEGLDLNAAYWIENLNAQAELVEHMTDRGGYDLETIWKLEGAAVEFWGTYSRTVRRLVRDWCTPTQTETLRLAETRMKEARSAARRAYLERREAEQDSRIVDELEAKRRAREARYAREQDYADTGA